MEFNLWSPKPFKLDVEPILEVFVEDTLEPDLDAESLGFLEEDVSSWEDPNISTSVRCRLTAAVVAGLEALELTLPDASLSSLFATLRVGSTSSRYTTDWVPSMVSTGEKADQKTRLRVPERVKKKKKLADIFITDNTKYDHIATREMLFYWDPAGVSIIWTNLNLNIACNWEADEICQAASFTLFPVPAVQTGFRTGWFCPKTGTKWPLSSQKT
jgi:hypothetical protein